MYNNFGVSWRTLPRLGDIDIEEKSAVSSSTHQAEDQLEVWPCYAAGQKSSPPLETNDYSAQDTPDISCL